MKSLKNMTEDIDIQQENQELRLRLEEAEETLRAIREGEIDGLIVNSSQGEQVFTLVGADHSYRMLIEEMNEGALTLSADGIILYCNRSFVRMMKTNPQELTGSSFFNLLTPSDLCNLQIEFAGNAGMTRREIDLLRGDYSPLPVHLSMNSMLVEGIEILSIVITDLSEMKERANELKLANDKLLQEIKERQRAEEAIHRSEQKRANILDSISDAFYALDREWRFTYVNAEMLRQFKIQDASEVIGQVIWKSFPNYSDLTYELFHKAVKEQTPVCYESNSQITGRWHYVHAYPSPDGLSVYFLDITERKRMEKEFARLDRLNLIGKMAASIGHEIRNPMTAVRGFIQLLNEQNYYAKDKVYFDLMIEELDRANGIISEYLGMAKDKPIDRQPQYLDQIVNDIYPLIEADANYKGMNIKLDLGKPPMTLIDKNEIRQLVLNIVRNGMDAMSEGGTLTIGTTIEAGEIVLFIKDEGQGLPPELLDKLGTPFLTTKANGTGLGLAVCYSIVSRHNARIDYETGHKGTTFKVYFPCENEQITLF